MRRATATSAFGVSRRESHDASAFYARFEAPDVSDDDEIHADKAIDRVFCGDARCMSEVPAKSVALVVTSPPYFAGKEYETALGDGHVPATYLEYLRLLEDVFAECVRTLEPGGRIAVNVANLGRKPYRSLAADVTGILQDRLRLLLRGEVVWQKARGSTGSCAWGSFQKPTNPVLRDLTERVVVASKGRFDRALAPSRRRCLGLPWISSLTRDEFMEATTDVWEIPAERASVVGHPAPFPVALPVRLIHLYTFVGDLVLDPFAGAGATAVAAVETGRHFAGYDTDPGYVEIARRRVAATTRVTDPAEVAVEDALRQAGFRAIERDVRLAPGVVVSFRASDQFGRTWLFEVCGGNTSSRPGLTRADAVWKALAKAAVKHEVEPRTPLVLLTAAAPAGGPLWTIVGPDRPVAAVIELGEVDRLGDLARQ